MALPAGVTKLGSFKGAKGDTGSLAFATAEKVAWTENPTVTMVGTEASRGAHFEIPLPLPGPETVNNDDATELLILNPTKTRAALDVAVGTLSLDRFPMVGDGVTNDAAAFSLALNTAKAQKRGLKGTPGKVYRIASPIEIALGPDETFWLDLGGATLDFVNGGRLGVGPARTGDTPTPFLTTTATTDLVRKKTKFAVASSEGVIKGDLVRVESPVEVVPGIPLSQTYVVEDVDGLDIYVSGAIVGDITAAQIAAAGAAGPRTVTFYRLNNGLYLGNGRLISSDRSSDSTLVMVTGQNDYLIENLTVETPTRTGLYTMYCGSGRIVNSTVHDAGYTSKDQGYVSVPSSPDGLSFGYGFVTSNSYLTHYDGVHSHAGWHGIDAARGQSVAIVQNSVFHKDALGVSAHEGAWDLRVIGSHFVGGNGVTSRAMELVIIGCHFRTSLGTAISGNGSHQQLIIKGNVFDLSAPNANFANWLYLNAPYPPYIYSAEPSYSEVSDNTVLGMQNVSTLNVAGRLVFKANIVHAGAGNSTTIQIQSRTVGQRFVSISDNEFYDGTGQYALSLADIEVLSVNRNARAGVQAGASGAFVSLGGVCPKVVAADNTLSGIEHLFRVQAGGAVSFSVLAKNTNQSGRLVLADTSSVIKNSMWNATAITATAGGVATTTATGNVLLTA